MIADRGSFCFILLPVPPRGGSISAASANVIRPSKLFLSRRFLDHSCFSLFQCAIGTENDGQRQDHFTVLVGYLWAGQIVGNCPYKIGLILDIDMKSWHAMFSLKTNLRIGFLNILIRNYIQCLMLFPFLLFGVVLLSTPQKNETQKVLTLAVRNDKQVKAGTRLKMLSSYPVQSNLYFFLNLKHLIKKRSKQIEFLGNFRCLISGALSSEINKKRAAAVEQFADHLNLQI